MTLNKLRLVFCLTVCAAITLVAANASAQESDQSARTAAAARESDVNLDTQLYLILATNRDTEDGKWGKHISSDQLRASGSADRHQYARGHPGRRRHTECGTIRRRNNRRDLGEAGGELTRNLSV